MCVVALKLLASIAQARTNINPVECEEPSEIVFDATVNQSSPFGYDLHFSWSGPENTLYEWQLTNGSPLSGTTTTKSVTILSVEAGIAVTFAVRTLCAENESSEWVSKQFVVPPVFCPDPDSVVISPTSTSVTMTWTYPITPYNGFEYIVEQTDNGALIAMDMTQTPSFSVTGLQPDTEYKITLNVWCDPAASEPTNVTVYTFRTTNAYCSSKGASSINDYIDLVHFNTLQRTSGDDNGYISTGAGTTVTAGEHYVLQVSAGGGQALRFLTVWIDYNLDGDFYDAHERVVARAFKHGDVIANVVVPRFVSAGMTTMRVTVQRHPTRGKSNNSEPCEQYPAGETEDYQITINPSDNQNGCIGITIFPNPVAETLRINGASDLKQVVITDHSGYVFYRGPVLNEWNISNWRPGIYYVKTSEGNGETIRFVKK